MAFFCHLYKNIQKARFKSPKGFYSKICILMAKAASTVKLK